MLITFALAPIPFSHLVQLFIAPRALATSGRRPGVRAKRAARGVAGHHLNNRQARENRTPIHSY